MLEDNELMKWTAISFLISFSCVWAYLIYVMHYGLVRSVTDILIVVGLPVGIIPTEAAYATFAILKCRKYHKPKGICAKNFLGWTSFTLGLVTLFSLLTLAADSAGLLENARNLIPTVTAIFLLCLGIALVIFIRWKKTFYNLS